MNRIWKCDVCEDVSMHKGLCRNCTEYGEDGSVLNAVARVRKNADGTNWKPPQRNNQISISERLSLFRQNRRRKPNKKQIKNLMDSLEINPEELQDLGDSVEEE